MVYIFQVAQNPDLVNTSYTFSFHTVGFFHVLYNMKISDNYENVLMEVCWNDSCMILVLEYQYVGKYNNSATYIFRVTMHVGMADRHTL